jgi:acyl-CoA reductase-like NAD-dependent aldehyde dehydrogenase
MKAAARVLRNNKDAYGRLMTEEMGKPIQQGIAEAEKCATACDCFADNAASFLAPEPAEGSANKELRHVPAHRRRTRRHAVEFSVLAGLPLRSACADGGQCGSGSATTAR